MFLNEKTVFERSIPNVQANARETSRTKFFVWNSDDERKNVVTTTTNVYLSVRFRHFSIYVITVDSCDLRKYDVTTDFFF